MIIFVKTYADTDVPLDPPLDPNKKMEMNS
jgi:hypothetical protein